MRTVIAVILLAFNILSNRADVLMFPIEKYQIRYKISNGASDGLSPKMGDWKAVPEMSSPYPFLCIDFDKGLIYWDTSEGRANPLSEFSNTYDVSHKSGRGITVLDIAGCKYSDVDALIGLYNDISNDSVVLVIKNDGEVIVTLDTWLFSGIYSIDHVNYRFISPKPKFKASNILDYLLHPMGSIDFLTLYRLGWDETKREIISATYRQPNVERHDNFSRTFTVNNLLLSILDKPVDEASVYKSKGKDMMDVISFKYIMYFPTFKEAADYASQLQYILRDVHNITLKESVNGNEQLAYSGEIKYGNKDNIIVVIRAAENKGNSTNRFEVTISSDMLFFQ